VGSKRKEVGRSNSLGLSDIGLQPVFDALDGQASAGASAPGRKAARWPIRHPSVRVEIEHPGGSRVEIRMACRNLSTTGAGLLHSGFVYPGTPCVVELPHPEHGPTKVPAQIVRCEHRAGVIHELGVKFAKRIDLRAFVRPNPVEQWFEAENVDAAKLSGRLLYIDQDPIHQKLAKHFLKETTVAVAILEDASEAVVAAKGDYDLIICEQHLKPSSGAEIAQLLRAENVRTPFLLTSLDTSQQVMKSVDGRTIQAFITKPFSESVFLRAVSEFLGKAGEHPAAGSDRRSELYDALKPHMIECADGLERAVNTGEAMDAVSLCVQLRQVSQALEMAALGAEIDEVLEPLTDTMDVAPHRDRLSDIVRQCRQAAA
jgi:DNA-binding response OmpR family regulator